MASGRRCASACPAARVPRLQGIVHFIPSAQVTVYQSHRTNVNIDALMDTRDVRVSRVCARFA
eukprot:984976-Lingulodinium_polyedra.AAC.1